MPQGHRPGDRITTDARRLELVPGALSGRPRAATIIAGLKQAPHQTVFRPSAASLDRRGVRPMDKTKSDPYTIAIVWRGDREARRAATSENNRFHRVFAELAGLGLRAEPAVYD